MTNVGEFGFTNNGNDPIIIAVTKVKPNIIRNVCDVIQICTPGCVSIKCAHITHDTICDTICKINNNQNEALFILKRTNNKAIMKHYVYFFFI